MDEPFQGLDYGIRMEMVNMLLEIWKIKKPGVLFVTHEIDEALTVATRIAVLTPRPTTIQTWITLPGREGRDASGAGTDGDPAGNYWSHHSLIVVAVAME